MPWTGSGPIEHWFPDQQSQNPGISSHLIVELDGKEQGAWDPGEGRLNQPPPKMTWLFSVILVHRPGHLDRLSTEVELGPKEEDIPGAVQV